MGACCCLCGCPGPAVGRCLPAPAICAPCGSTAYKHPSCGWVGCHTNSRDGPQEPNPQKLDSLLLLPPWSRRFSFPCGTGFLGQLWAVASLPPWDQLQLVRSWILQLPVDLPLLLCLVWVLLQVGAAGVLRGQSPLIHSVTPLLRGGRSRVLNRTCGSQQASVLQGVKVVTLEHCPPSSILATLP